MAVTANQLIKMQEGCKRSYPVEQATRIYQGTLVYVNAAGYACDVTATGVNAFVGIAVAEADNTSGADGAIEVEVHTEGDFELTGTFNSITDVGMPAYGDDNYSVVVAIGSTSVRIGRVVRFVSTTKAIIGIKPSNVGALELAALTLLTHTAPGTPDYAIQNLTTSTPYGFVTADEGNTVLKVVAQLQARVAILEAR